MKARALAVCLLLTACFPQVIATPDEDAGTMPPITTADSGTCVPAACAAGMCGSQSDGCGGTLECGACCVAKTCATLGVNCGAVADGCGGTLQCGGCSGSDSCGGSGTENVCGRPCALGCPAGFTCNAQGVCAGGDLTHLTLDVKVVRLSGTVTLNGAVPASTCAAGDERAWLDFIQLPSRASGGRIPIPCTGTTFAFDGLVTPGTYEVRVQEEDGVTNLPHGPVVVHPGLELTADSTRTFDVRAFTVSGNVTLDGVNPAKSCNVANPPGAIVWTDAARGATFEAVLPCAGAASPYSVLLPAGTYDVVVRGGGSNLPSSAKALSAVVVSANRPGLPVDVETLPVSGTVTLDGVAPAGSCRPVLDHERGFVRLTPVSGAPVELPIPCSGAATFSGRLPRGTYAVRVIGTHSDLPLAAVPPIASASLVVQGPVTGLALEVRTFVVAGAVTLNGAPVTSGLACIGGQGRIELSNATSTHAFDIGCTGSTFSGRVPPGTWRVTVERAGRDSNLPVRAITVDPALVVSANRPGLALDTKVSNVAARVTANGTMTTGCLLGANVLFEELRQGGESFTQRTRCSDQGLDAELIAGSAYRVTVTGDWEGSLPPLPTEVRPSWVAPQGSAMLALDVLVHMVGVRVTQNAGIWAPCTSGSRGTIIFRQPMTTAMKSAAVPCGSGPAQIDVPLVSGTFETLITGASGVAHPSPGTVTVSSALGMTTLELTTKLVAGEVTVNGGPPSATCSNGSRGKLTFKGPRQDAVASIPCGSSPTFTFAADLLTGATYTVAVQWETGGRTYPMGTLQVP